MWRPRGLWSNFESSKIPGFHRILTAYFRASELLYVLRVWGSEFGLNDQTVDTDCHCKNVLDCNIDCPKVSFKYSAESAISSIIS